MLPQRPLQHVIADRALDIVKSLLPAEWIVRRQDGTGDYGLDLEVEIAGATVTGDLFKVQVKGHQRIPWNKDNQYCQSVREETLSYWQAIPLPVVLVVVDLSEREAYWVLFRGEYGQASVRLSQTRTLSSSITELENDVRQWLMGHKTSATIALVPLLSARWASAQKRVDRDCFLPVSDDDRDGLQWIYGQVIRVREALGMPRRELFSWEFWLARSQATFGEMDSFYYGTYDEVIAYLHPVAAETLNAAANHLQSEAATEHNCSTKNWAERFAGTNTTWVIENSLTCASVEFWSRIDEQLQASGALRHLTSSMMRERALLKNK